MRTVILLSKNVLVILDERLSSRGVFFSSQNYHRVIHKFFFFSNLKALLDLKLTVVFPLHLHPRHPPKACPCAVLSPPHRRRPTSRPLSHFRTRPRLCRR